MADGGLSLFGTGVGGGERVSINGLASSDGRTFSVRISGPAS